MRDTNRYQRPSPRNDTLDGLLALEEVAGIDEEIELLVYGVDRETYECEQQEFIEQLQADEDNSSFWCTCSLKGSRHERPDCLYFNKDEAHICGDSASSDDPLAPCRCADLYGAA